MKKLLLLVVLFVGFKALSQKRDTLEKNHFSQEMAEKLVTSTPFLEYKGILYNFRWIEGKYVIVRTSPILAKKVREKKLYVVYMSENKL